MKRFGVVVTSQEYYEIYSVDEEEAKIGVETHKGKLVETEDFKVKEVFEIK